MTRRRDAASRLLLRAGIGLALSLPLGGAAAPDPTVGTPVPALASGLEPITPVPPPPPADPRKLALGERLFEDPDLSRDRTRSCHSCHDIRANGAGGRRYDRAVDGSALTFNTSTVFDAALSFRLGWEGRYRDLEDQVAASLQSPRALGLGLDEAVDRLRHSRSLVAAFYQAYGHEPDRDSLVDAITIYLRSLVTPASRFDRWLEGDAAALTDEEREGYHLFKSFGCITCHQGVNVGGNLFERQGIFRPLAAPNPPVVRVPSLRNVATTAPYFHDGSAATLEEAVHKMGAAQLDRTLSDRQVAAIVAFLRTLTGTYRGAAVTAPPAGPVGAPP